MVCRVNGLAYCLSRISTWQGASPYGVPLGRPVGLLTAAGNSSLPLAMYCHIRCQGETIATQCVALSDSQSLCSLVQLIRPSVEHGIAAQEWRIASAASRPGRGHRLMASRVPLGRPVGLQRCIADSPAEASPRSIRPEDVQLRCWPPMPRLCSGAQ